MKTTRSNPCLLDRTIAVTVTAAMVLSLCGDLSAAWAENQPLPPGYVTGESPSTYLPVFPEIYPQGPAQTAGVGLVMAKQTEKMALLRAHPDAQSASAIWLAASADDIHPIAAEKGPIELTPDDWARVQNDSAIRNMISATYEQEAAAYAQAGRPSILAADVSQMQLMSLGAAPPVDMVERAETIAQELVVDSGRSLWKIILWSAVAATSLFALTGWTPLGRYLKEKMSGWTGSNGWKKVALTAGWSTGLAIGTLRTLGQFIEPEVLRIYKRAKNLAPAMTYAVNDGSTLKVLDPYKNASGKLSAANLKDLNHYLSLLPQDHLRQIEAILHAPDHGEYAGLSVVIENPVGRFISKLAGVGLPRIITFQSPAAIYDDTLAHEVGHHVRYNLPKPLADEWKDLHEKSSDKWQDFVESWGGPAPASSTTPPYGSGNIDEDFATIYGGWLASGSTQGNSTMMDYAIGQATRGHPILLEKVLFVASLFNQGGKLPFYDWDPFSDVNRPTMRRKDLTYAQTTDALTVGNYTFSLQNGHLTGVQTPTLKQAFTQPIPLPRLAS